MTDESPRALAQFDEDADDLAASDAVMTEIKAGAPTIPWDEAKAAWSDS